MTSQIRREPPGLYRQTRSPAVAQHLQRGFPVDFRSSVTAESPPALTS
jgi:hypothetical protein